ncbi:hypothetical protein CCYS_01100 [Corynebacterium cystitidis DSM 20524]|uniref:Uncharacterized protein n=1 Tax=Corynebacterium cystitidis DSM 20524 TaxID=1121357 RepID=A0A1H9U6E4_9CORY|nr:hypothetical protein CCYS_01100 [Corynebacterium cystitidis DSM 20524]SES05046.1 hypothetical protein SAMN05661109_01690 [Corynebacterium cystitidis DSM 20524]SNV89457.1 Uncharacterised protein [Corynebacterium cystitidis]
MSTWRSHHRTMSGDKVTLAELQRALESVQRSHREAKEFLDSRYPDRVAGATSGGETHP